MSVVVFSNFVEIILKYRVSESEKGERAGKQSLPVKKKRIVKFPGRKCLRYKQGQNGVFCQSILKLKNLTVFE